MGRQKSFIKLEGTFDDLTFYERSGKQLVRKKGSLDKDRILKDPNFKRTRENMQEFGGAARVSKFFRHTLNALISEQGGSLAASRLTGLFKRLASKGPGKRGQRDILMAPNTKFFDKFEFNEEREFKEVFKALYPAPEIDANRSVVTWELPAFLNKELLVPEGTTHYQFFLATTALSDHVYDEETRLYEPLVSEFAERRAVAMGDLVPYEEEGSSTPETLSTDLELTEPMPETVVSISVVGVLFFQESNGTMYPLHGKQSLRIEKVA